MAKRKPEEHLLLRYGGMGDAMFLTPVARHLHEEGKRVIVATCPNAVPLLENNPHIAEVWTEERWGPISAIDGRFPVNLIPTKGGMVPDLGIYDRFRNKRNHVRPYNITNYFLVIEGNTHHPQLYPTQNSDFVNTYDMHLSWAGIDPHALTDEQKAPQYFPRDSELTWADTALEGLPRPIYGFQPYASSPVRTYYRATALLENMAKRPGSVLVWNPQTNMWQVNGAPIQWPEGVAPIRSSAALINRMDLLISADTCVSHLAEAMGVQHMTFYTTVPAFSRSQYYRFETTIDVEVKYLGRVCKCCIINRDCPRRIHSALYKSDITKKEREMLSTLPMEQKQKLGIESLEPIDLKGKQPYEHFGMTPQGANQAINAAAQKLEAEKQKEAFCAASLDLWPHVREIMDELS